MAWIIPLEKSRFMIVFSIYHLNLVATEADKDSFDNCLSAELSRVPSADKFIALGDFNARVGAERDQCGGVLGRNGMNICNGNSLKILSLCYPHVLCITNSLFQLRDMHKSKMEAH